MALGGIKVAKVPPAATTPAASFYCNPLSSISGIATLANTAAVAVLAPETAANPAVAKTVATAIHQVIFQAIALQLQTVI